MEESGWYSVRCIFAVAGDVNEPITYEERITLWRADDEDDAVMLAQAEATEYAEGIGLQCLELAQSYALSHQPGHGAEVFSLLRDSPLERSEYLDAYFDTGAERQRRDPLPP